jgi:signal transduction histidine kinase
MSYGATPASAALAAAIRGVLLRKMRDPSPGAMAAPHREGSSMTSRQWIAAVASAAAGLGAASALVLGGYQTPQGDLIAALVLVLGVGWSFAGLGLIGWVRWPLSHTGPLMVVVSLAWFARGIGAVDNPTAFGVGVLIGAVYLAVLGHLIVTYPSGRFETLPQKAVVTCGYLCTVPMALAARWLLPEGGVCGHCPFNQLVGSGTPDRPTGSDRALVVLVLLTTTAVLGVMAQRWHAATPARRRSLAPALAGATAILTVLLAQRIAVGFGAAASVATSLSWLLTGALMLWPVGLLVGLAQERLDRSAVADLILELGGTRPPGGTRQALARALHDPSLQIAFYLPEHHRYVDDSGAPLPDPTESAGRAVTTLTRDGDVIAALTHDRALDDRPQLVSAVAAAAGLAVENERLHAQARAHLVEIRASRTRLVAAADAERRKVERNLHDGAQQRMLNLIFALQLAKSRLGSGAYRGADQALDQASSELALALNELRDLARGIHPAVLTDSGLGPAVRALAQRSGIPVLIHDTLPDHRYRPAVEETAYFIISEALANAAKHASASQAVVSIGEHDGEVRIEVRDDGIGGATSLGGTGLRGLADRVDAYSGRLRIDSPPGDGTRLSAALPCG